MVHESEYRDHRMLSVSSVAFGFTYFECHWVEKTDGQLQLLGPHHVARNVRFHNRSTMDDEFEQLYSIDGTSQHVSDRLS